MIRVACPSCGAKLNAKDQLAGHIRKCPGCGGAVRIPKPSPAQQDPSAPSAMPAAARPAASAVPATPAAATAVPGPPTVESEGAIEGAAVRADEEHPHPTPVLERLNRVHRYLICDRSKVVAMWQNNGQGWQVRTNNGFGSAARNRDGLPSQGDFVLVELKLATTETGLHLTGLACFRLASRWALTSLDKGDDRILATIVGQGSLFRDQKNAVRESLREHFMRPVWADSQEVLEYLNNADFHSPGVA